MKQNSFISKKHFILLSFLISTVNMLYAQDKKFTASISGGPDYYYNNIKIFKDNVKPMNYAFFARVMWNSKYAASLGLETGYNKYYSVGGFNNANIKSTLVAIPFHLVFGMRLTKHFYTNLAFGPSVLLNNAQTESESVKNKVFSYADGSAAIGYKRLLNEHFSLGIEIKYSFSTKAADMNLALPVVLSYHFN